MIDDISKNSARLNRIVTLSLRYCVAFKNNRIVYHFINSFMVIAGNNDYCVPNLKAVCDTVRFNDCD